MWEARILQKVKEMSPAARVRQDEADRLKAQAVALRPLARLEDLHPLQMEKVKTTKKGSQKNAYWLATWRESGQTQNAHLGTCKEDLRGGGPAEGRGTSQNQTLFGSLSVRSLLPQKIF